jgi:GT2 family glycosyltransferase
MASVLDPMTQRRVGAVVVTHSRPDLGRECLASLNPLVPPERAVVVVNSPERDDLDGFAGVARVILNERPAGYGENLNRGVEAVGRDVEYILLLNDDLVFAPAAVAVLVAALDADPAAGLAAPAIVDRAGCPQPAVFAFPSVRSEAAQAAMLPSRMASRVRADHASVATPGPPRRVDWVLGAAMLVRRRAFDDIGGFDPGYFLYSEETDLCLRLRENGWGVVSCGDAVVAHLAATSTAGVGFSRMLGRSRGRYVRRHFTPAQQFVLAAALGCVYVWNLAYVTARVLLDPRSAPDKLRLLVSHWRTRPLLQGE